MNKGTDVILVTGATGKQGGSVARELLAKGHKVRAMTRQPDGVAAQALAKLGAEVVRGDLDDAASLEGPLRGAWGVFAVQNTFEAGVEGEEQQGKRMAEAARKQGVQHYIYTSVGSAHRKTGIPHFENKWRVEEKVRALGFPSHTIIRPVFFMENWTGPSFLPSIQEGKLAIGIRPTTPLQMVALRDIGAIGALAFERHAEWSGRGIDLAGDEHTMPQTAEILSKATGRKIEFLQLPIEQVRQFSADFAAMLEWFDKVGYNVDIPKLAKETGVQLTTLEDWAAGVEWQALAGSKG